MVAVCRTLPFQAGAAEAEKLRVAQRELVPEDPQVEPPRDVVLGPYLGVEHKSLWEGMVVRRRVYVAADAGVVLYAAAAEGDPFPQAQAFFDSLLLEPPLVPVTVCAAGAGGCGEAKQ